MEHAELVRIALAIELVLLIVLGMWLRRRFKWSRLRTVGTMIVLSLGVRLVWVIISFAVSSRIHPERPPNLQIGAAGIVNAVFNEWRAIVVDNYVLLPFDAAFVKDHVAPADKRLPIVLVHGYFSNKGMLQPLHQRLVQQGHNVFVFNYPPISGGPRSGVEPLKAAIDRALATTGASQAIVIGHSMGGLAARLLAAEGYAPKMAHLITLATPHAGTEVAKLGLGDSARYLESQSPFYAELRGKEAAAAARVPMTSIFTVHDNLVAPFTSSALPGVAQVPLAGVGHVAVIGDEKALLAVEDAIDRVSSKP